MTKTYTIKIYEQNQWTQDDTGTHKILRDDCGHKHRTIDGAERCRKKLIGYKNGSWSAYWNRAEIVDNDNHLVDYLDYIFK